MKFSLIVVWGSSPAYCLDFVDFVMITLRNLEEIFLRYYMHSSAMLEIFKFQLCMCYPL